jgi:dolichol-phosphate mannosyltransferase
MAAKVTVVIPTYNERANIRELIEEILALGSQYRILIVDDRSPDGTAAEVKALGEDRVEILERSGQRGYGRAVVAGFRKALEGDADLIVSMDADFSHDPSVIPELVGGAEDADVVLGSRYCPDGGTLNWPIYRMILSRTANRYVRAILRLPAQDSTSGFRCYRRQVLESIDLEGIRSEGYSFLVEVLYRAWLAGARMTEVPILFKDRVKGKSKINSKEIYRSIFMVLWLKGSIRRD